MIKEQARQRIEKLKKLINHYRSLYHVYDRSEISEPALDSLKKELFDLEQEFPEMITPDSPTQRVGGKPLVKFEKVKHLQPMLSLNDAFSEEDLQNWFDRNAKLLGPQEIKNLDFYCEPKLDGLAIELVYSLGDQGGVLLKTGSTRGDGKIGENVTQNIKTIEAIPLRLRDKKEFIADLEKQKLETVISFVKKNGLKNVTVRGEAIITKKEFLLVNKNQAEQGLIAYANARNLAAGSIRQLDPKITAKRHLDSNAYELLTDLGQETHEQGHLILKALGFKTNNKYSKYCRNLEQVTAFRNYWQEHRESLPYEVDGIVVIINNNNIFRKLGVIGKSPRGTLAFKFPLRQATTIIEDIKFQVGRTGAITPVAVLKPVQLGGVTISRATLHNEDEIKRLGIRIGDTVIVGRAGDVIPDIIKALPELRTGREKLFSMPKICPSCGAPLARPGQEAIWRCLNPHCSAKKRENFYHFVSKNTFDINGLGPKIINKLFEAGLISDPADLFTLEAGDILGAGFSSGKNKNALIPGLAQKSALKLVAAIREKKKISLPRFIFALGIRNVGEETSQDLAERFGRIENLEKASLEELEKIKDIGPVAAASLFSFFKNKKNSAFLQKIKSAGVLIENYQLKKKNKKISGLTFVITGTLESLTREGAKSKIREQGGQISESISRSTSFLIAGSLPGSKLAEAKKLGVKIITEKEFLAII
ncbi:MAG: NAD-dependent DNA ligase LigA [bacterium]|nr:NAD-dependent DNA ligase LigA [bacterium]